MASSTSSGCIASGNQASLQDGSAVFRVLRDEILDGRTRIVGYRFRLEPVGPEGTQDAAARRDALRSDNLAAFVHQRIGIVPISVKDWHAVDFREFASPNTVFHLGLAREDDAAAWQRAVEAIRASGAALALDWTLVESGHAEALGLAELVFVRPSEYSAETLRRIVEELHARYPGTRIAADGIGSWSEYRACLALGAHYGLGNFTATPYVDDELQRQQVLNNVLDNKLVQFYWYRVFECGCESIDRDHQALFAFATDLLNAIMASKPQQKLAEMVDQLLVKATEHFQHEEAVLLAAGYPRLEHHAEVHRELAARAGRLVDDFKAGRAEIGAVFQFLAQDLIVNHMLGADRDFFPLFLQPRKRVVVATLANGKGPACPLPAATPSPRVTL